MLWGVLLLMVAVTVAGLTLPLVRRAGDRSPRGTTLAVLKAQLKDLEAADDAEAEGLRAELKRRILAEGRETAVTERPMSERARIGLALGLAAAVALTTGALYLGMGRPDLAAGGRVEPAPAGYRSAQGEALVQRANGRVTPEALAAFNAALAADPKDPRARFFLGLAKRQAGDADGALADWIALANDAPAGAAWGAEVRAVVQRDAAERGVDLAGRLGPDPQAQMIRAMVEGLDARLRADPADAEGWIRLMRSRMVLGEPAKAAEAYRAARRAFADDPAQLAALQQAARDLGTPGA